MDIIPTCCEQFTQCSSTKSYLSKKIREEGVDNNLITAEVLGKALALVKRKKHDNTYSLSCYNTIRIKRFLFARKSILFCCIIEWAFSQRICLMLLLFSFIEIFIGLFAYFVLNSFAVIILSSFIYYTAFIFCGSSSSTRSSSKELSSSSALFVPLLTLFSRLTVIQV